MQPTMTLAHDVSEREVAWVVRQGLKHKNVRLIGMLPAFYSGRYELAPDARRRFTLSDRGARYCGRLFRSCCGIRFSPDPVLPSELRLGHLVCNDWAVGILSPVLQFAGKLPSAP